MRWEGRRESQNVEDRRGRGGGAGGRPTMLVGGGIGSLILILVLMFLGVDPRMLIGGAGGGGIPGGSGLPGGFPGVPGYSQNAPSAPTDPAEDKLAGFVKVVLADTEDVWNKLFRDSGRKYEEPRLVLFNGSVSSACGMASSASGPFYCPGDQQVYIDLGFYQELKERFRAPGDFAQAYVIAHEVGHHVQNLLGITDQIDAMRGRVSQEEYNRLSVRLELQADFLAGVWAHHAQKTKQILESGDIEEALGAASAIGDDNIQMKTQGYVVPESFTHGTAQQRAYWFRRGLQTGDMTQGDTFKIQEP